MSPFGNSDLRFVSSNECSAIWTIVICVFARIHNIRDPSTRPTPVEEITKSYYSFFWDSAFFFNIQNLHKSTEKCCHNMSFSAGLVVQFCEYLLSARWTNDRTRIWSYRWVCHNGWKYYFGILKKCSFLLQKKVSVTYCELLEEVLD